MRASSRAIATVAIFVGLPAHCRLIARSAEPASSGDGSDYVGEGLAACEHRGGDACRQAVRPEPMRETWRVWDARLGGAHHIPTAPYRALGARKEFDRA